MAFTFVSPIYSDEDMLEMLYESCYSRAEHIIPLPDRDDVELVFSEGLVSTAGMVVVKYGSWRRPEVKVICKLSPPFYRKVGGDKYRETIFHELCHISQLYEMRYVGHDYHFFHLMDLLGFPGHTRCHSYGRADE